MALYYCSRGDITDLLPSLTGSDIASTAQQDAKLRDPSRAWIDSVYPSLSPFAHVATNDAKNWRVNQSDHASSDTTVTIDNGTGDPAVGDIMRVVGDNQWDEGRLGTRPNVDDSQEYRVTNYTSNVVTYTPSSVIDFVDNAPIHFGTPMLVRRASTLYAVHLAFQILRQNALDQEAAQILGMAREALHIPNGRFLAKARPESTSDLRVNTTRVIMA